MQINVDFTDLHRSAVAMNGPAYVAGFDACLAGRAYSQNEADITGAPARFKQGFEYGERFKSEGLNG